MQDQCPQIEGTASAKFPSTNSLALFREEHSRPEGTKQSEEEEEGEVREGG